MKLTNLLGKTRASWDSAGNELSSAPVRRTLGRTPAVVLSWLAAVPGALGQSQVRAWGEHVFDSAWNQRPSSRSRRAGTAPLRAAATARSSPGGATTSGSATCPPCRRPRLRRGRGGRPATASRAAATARSSPGETTPTASATCPAPPPGSQLRRGRRGRRPHPGAAQRRLGRRLGRQHYGQCNVPALPPGLTYVEVAAGFGIRRGAPQRRLGRRLGGQQLRPVQRARAAAGLTYVEVARGRRSQRSRCAATARSSPGATTPPASATCPRSPPGSPTSRSRPDATHTVARRSDGSVVAWGDNYDGQCNVPALPPGLAYVEIAAGGTTPWRAAATARSSPGEHNNYGQCNVPRLAAGLAYVEVAAGVDHTVARAQRRLGRRVGRQPAPASATCPRLPPGLDLRRGRGGR